MGRITKKWGLLGTEDILRANHNVWTKHLVRLVLQYGITMLKFRNSLVHGTEGGISIVERIKVKNIVSEAYERIGPWVSEAQRWMFLKPLPEKLEEPSGLLISWMNRVKKVFPTKYKEIRAGIGTVDSLGTEINYILARKVGQTGL